MKANSWFVLALALGGFLTPGATAAEGEVKWILPLGPITSPSPPAANRDSDVYVTVGRESDALCYSIAPDGSTNWVRQLPGEGTILAPTVLGDGTVLVVTRQHLFALSPKGEVKWSLAFWNDLYSNPIIGPEGSIYFFISDPQRPELWSVARDGKVNWRQSIPNNPDVLSLAVGADGTIYCSSPSGDPRNDGWIAAIAPETGLLKDIRPFPPPGAFAGWLALPGNYLMFSGVVFSPELEVVHQPRVGLGSPNYSGPWCAVDTWGNIFGGSMGGWDLVKSRLGHGLSNFPVVFWRASDVGNPPNIALGNDGSVIATRGSGTWAELRCLNSQGETKWSFIPPVEPGQSATHLGSGAPIIAPNGTIYFTYLVYKAGLPSAQLAAVEGPPTKSRRTWSQPRADLRRSGRLAGPDVDVLIDSVRKLSDGTAEVVVIGEPDQTYGVEYTDDFATWLFLGEGLSANGCFRILDPGAKGKAARFYRLKQP